MTTPTTASLRQTTAVPTAMFVAAVVCIVRSSSFLPSPTPGRRSLRLVPTREIIRYHVDPARAVLPGAALVEPAPWFEDVDYRQWGLCGRAKCFFPSVTDPSRGYLVGRPEYALMLESEYGVRHFNVGPSFEVEMPEYFRQHLQDEYVPFYEDAESLIVQPSRTAPDGSVIVSCHSHSTLYGRLAYVLKSMNKYSQQRLQRELEQLIYVARHQPELPELIADFQLLIDRKGGTFHLDLDRVENPASPKDVHLFEGCLEGAVDFVRKYKGEKESVAVSVEALKKYWQDSSDWMAAHMASFFARISNSISVEALKKYAEETGDWMADQSASSSVGFFEALAEARE